MYTNLMSTANALHTIVLDREHTEGADPRLERIEAGNDLISTLIPDALRNAARDDGITEDNEPWIIHATSLRRTNLGLYVAGEDSEMSFDTKSFSLDEITDTLISIMEAVLTES